MTKVLQGTLDYFNIPETLQFLNMNEKTGMLSVLSDLKKADLFLRNGDLIFASSNQDRFRLANILYQKKKIDSAQLTRLQRRMEHLGEKFGKTAVQENVLTEEELQNFLKIQASEIIYDSFTWNSGTFSFVKNGTPPDHAVLFSVGLTNLIMEGARRMDELSYLYERLPSRSAHLRVVSNPEVHDKISLSLDEWQVLFLINGTRTLDEICNESTEETLKIYKVIYGLYANKLIEVVPEDPSRMKTAELVIEEKAPATDQIVIHKDTDLLISPTAKLTWKDMMKSTIAELAWKKSTGEEVLFPLTEEEYRLGSATTNTIHLPDPSVSSSHARIVKGQDGYILEDLKSTRGCFLNGMPVERELLHDKDRLRIGNMDLVFNIIFKP